MDLFEHYEELPLPIQTVINNQGEIESYDDCRELLAKLEVFGYTFNYGLDAEPYDLRKITITIDDFDDVVTDGDGTRWSQLCEDHAHKMVREHTKHEIYQFGSGICGVKGCDVESEYYIDFN